MVVGQVRRYAGRGGPIDEQTDAELRALRLIAALVGHRRELVTDRDVAIRVGALLRAPATEPSAGRAAAGPAPAGPDSTGARGDGERG